MAIYSMWYKIQDNINEIHKNDSTHCQEKENNNDLGTEEQIWSAL